jgi:hypothetical protein
MRFIACCDPPECCPALLPCSLVHLRDSIRCVLRVASCVVLGLSLQTLIDGYAAISGLAYTHPYRNFTSAVGPSAWAKYWPRKRCYMQAARFVWI